MKRKLWEEVTPERQTEIIEKIAQSIVKHGMETPGILFLHTMRPVTYFSSHMALVMFGAFLPDSALDYIKVFEKKENIEKSLSRIDELVREKENEKPKGPGVIKRLREYLRKTGI